MWNDLVAVLLVFVVAGVLVLLIDGGDNGL